MLAVGCCRVFDCPVCCVVDLSVERMVSCLVCVYVLAICQYPRLYYRVVLLLYVRVDASRPWYRRFMCVVMIL